MTPPLRGRDAVLGCFARFLVLVLVLVAIPGTVRGQEAAADPLAALTAESFVLMDAATGVVLSERNADAPIPPASLAKVMTLYLVWKDIANGAYGQDDPWTVPPEGGAGAMPPGSSLMGLEAGQVPTVRELQLGAAVASGNDAARNLALLSAGGIDAFVGRMNAEARAMGLSGTRYADPDGWSETASTTAGDQARLAAAYVRDFPAALAEIHDVASFDWPPPVDPGAPARRLRNSNPLIGSYEGADGLKTGTIPEAGFHLIATASRGGTRLIAVVMGIRADRYVDGLKARAEQAAALLDYGFARWRTVRPAVPGLPSLPVRRGTVDSVRPVPAAAAAPLTLRSVDAASLVAVVDLPEAVAAPLEAGTVIGSVTWWAGGTLVSEVPLAVPDDLPAAHPGWLRLLSFLRIGA